LKIFASNTKYLIAGSSPWKLFAGKEVLRMSNVGDKLSITTNITRLVNLKREFLRGTYVSLKIFSMSHNYTDMATDGVI
jgi:hypothetical protein